MSDSSPLIVPVEIDALVVNDSTRSASFARWRMNYGAMALLRSADPAPFSGLDTSFTAPGATMLPNGVTVSEYYNGIYLKWRLPDALRHGAQDSAAGTVRFPNVPNRWLIVRNGEAAWLVESDFINPRGSASRSYADTGSDFIDASGNAITIGRTVALSAAGWSEPGRASFLSAVGPGNLAFSAYQPACNNVFSFLDQPPASAPGPYEYLLLGWHSSTQDDPLHGVAAADFAARMQQLGWALPLGTDTAASASSVVYCASLSAVAGLSTVKSSGAPAKEDVSIAIADSSARALATLVAQQAQADKAAIDAELLEALVLDLVRVYDQPDGAAAVEEATFATGFRAHTGGASWTLVPSEAAGAPPPPPLSDSQQAALSVLNHAQLEADAATRGLDALRRELYELWFKYELLEQMPTPPSGITPQELQQELEPAHPGGLAARVVLAEGAVQSTAAAVTAALAKATAPGYSAKQINRGAFFQRSDPVVLLSRAGAPAAATNAKLTCRLAEQIVRGFEYAGKSITAATPGIAVPAPAIGPLSGAPWPAQMLAMLLGEGYFLNPANAEAIATDALHDPSLAKAVAAAMAASSLGVPPANRGGEWTAQPWRPLYLMWQGSYYPIDHGPTGAPNWTFTNGRYTWSGQGAAPTSEALELEGRIMLTPQASVMVGARLQTLLDTTPDLPPSVRQAIESLKGYVQSKDDWDLLSQALGGFNDQLLKRTTGAFISPASATLKTTPSLAELIAGGAGNPPRPAEDTNRPAFQPWRCGQFQLTALALVDEWGQALYVTDSSEAQQLILHRPEEMLPTPSVLTPEPDQLAQLSPALLQPGRLNFDLVSAADATKVLGLDPDVDPICGWVLPNHIDEALLVFTADGSPAGELGLGLGPGQSTTVVWRAAPDGKYPTPASLSAIAHLGPFLQQLYAGGPSELAAMLAAIDETLWTTAPVGSAFDRNLATLAGRPLAMVRARLAFELESSPLSDPSWSHTRAPAPTPAPGYPFAVELGNLTKLSDGLIGYLLEEASSPFYVVAQSGAKESQLLHLIGAGNGLLELSFDGNRSALVSMLVDPRAAVHASSDILPVSSVTLPAALVSEALSNIDLSFRVGPLLTEQGSGAGGTEALLMPTPAGGGNWTWLDAGSWKRSALGPTSTRASLNDALPTVRSGLLDLQSAFAKQDDPEKGSDP